MRWVIFSMLLLVSMILDAGNVLNVIALGQWNVRPGVLITVLVFSTLNSGSRYGIICGFATGFAADVAGAVMGPHMLCFGIIGLILTRFQKTMTLRRFPHQMAVVFLTFLAAELPAYALSVFKTGEKTPHILPVLLLTGAYSSLAAPFVWAILRSLWPKVQTRTMGRTRLSR